MGALPMGRARHAPELLESEEHGQLTARRVALFRAMHAVVRKIPRGRVLTYGQLAELAGLPGGARVAGAAMKHSEGMPWQRVVGKAGPRRGRIAIHDPVGAAIQRQKLAAEGVTISAAGMIDLTCHGWIEAEPAHDKSGRAGGKAGAGRSEPKAAKRKRRAGR